MQNRPAGSYIEDENGDLRPNLNDEAMKGRQEKPEVTGKEKKKEVKDNG